MPDTFPTGPTPLSLDQHLGEGACLGLFGSWRPPRALILPLAERVRAALMRASDGRVPAQVSGKNAAGEPREGHDHLYVLPIERSPSGGLDRVLLWAQYGLEADTRELLEHLAQAGGEIGFRGRPRLRMELLSLGDRAQLDAAWTRRVLGPASVWRSCSSFVAPRFPKRRGGEMLDAPREQLARLLALVHGLEALELGEMMEPEHGWASFEQRRYARPDAPRRVASGWRVRFAQPVAGPLALGYGAHFGLGRFEALASTGRVLS